MTNLLFDTLDLLIKFKKKEKKESSTSILRLYGDDTLSLWSKALRGLSLHFELVWDILSQVGHCQGGFWVVPLHINVPGFS